MPRAIRSTTSPKTRALRGSTSRAAADNEFELVMSLKLNLQATREKLMLVQPDTLSDKDHAIWGDQIYKVSLAINAVRKALLGSISAAFAAELPKIEQATTKLRDDLFRLQGSIDILKAVSSALGIIESLVTLAG